MSEEQLIATPGVFGENGNFLLERELGRGGMGGVYMGRDKMLDRPVAVKVMLKEYGSDPEFVEKFKKEAQAVARLIHPNIAQVYSYGLSDGMPYIAMELVAGGSLDGLMKTKGKDIDVPRVMKICEQVAQALRCAADQGLVHGDVKPENVLLDANGNAKLVDFGLAAMQKDTEEIWGTPYYIAPEKCRRQPVDYRADMYSLGGTIYHALTGVPPFEGDDATEVVKKRFMGMPKKPSELRPGLSPQIDALVMTMLALEPQDRYPSFEALLEEFKKVMTTGLSMTSPLSPAAAAAAGAAAGAGTPSKTTLKGGKKVVMKGKKGFKVKKPTAPGDENQTDGVADIPPEEGSEGSEGAEEAKKQDDEEDEGGGLGLKVIGVIVGVVALIGAVVGGLVWYQAANRAAEERERQAQIQKGFDVARESLNKTRAAAVDFKGKVAEFSEKTMSTCEGITSDIRDVLAQKYSENVLAMLKPAETDELKAAIAGVSAPETSAAAPEPQPAAPAPEATPAAPAEATAPAPEAAPAAPEAPAAEEAKPAEEVPSVVNDVNELWKKAYHVKAVSIQVDRSLDGLIANIDAALAISGDDLDTMRTLESKANEFKDQYDAISGSPEIAGAQKDAGLVTSRGNRLKANTIKNLEQEARDEQRRKDAKGKRVAELTRELADLRERYENAEREVNAAKEAFNGVIASGRLRQLDWKGMKRMLEAATADMTTPEGPLQIKKELRKIEAMEFSQKVMIDNLKGYTFTKGKLKGCAVQSADEREIVVARPDGRKAPAIGWTKFYRDYHGNLNELVMKFIRGGRQNGKERLSHLKWFNAMIGTAYTLGSICADDPTTATFVTQLVTEAVSKDMKLNSDRDASAGEEPAVPDGANETDEEIKGIFAEMAEVRAKMAELNKQIKIPFYRELFPEIDYDKIATDVENE